MERQKATNPDSEHRTDLTPQQEAAVDLLAVGSTLTHVAKTVGVARQTVSEWINHNHRFKAALNRRRQELWEGLTDRMRGLLPKALETLDTALDGDGRVACHAAVQVLKACGMYALPQPMGSTDAIELEIEEQERETDRRYREMIAGM